MEAWERGFLAMPERLAEMTRLKETFHIQDKKPSLEWMTECITAISVEVDETENREYRTELIAIQTKQR